MPPANSRKIRQDTCRCLSEKFVLLLIFPDRLKHLYHSRQFEKPFGRKFRSPILCMFVRSPVHVAGIRSAYQFRCPPRLGGYACRTLSRTGAHCRNGYAEVWIRDLNTFITLVSHVADHARLHEVLIRFSNFRDRMEMLWTDISRRRVTIEGGGKCRYSELAPGFIAGHGVPGFCRCRLNARVRAFYCRQCSQKAMELLIWKIVLLVYKT